jgi:hypothetical protein
MTSQRSRGLTRQGSPVVTGVEFPQVSPGWVDTPETWTGLGLTQTYGDQHENR